MSTSTSVKTKEQKKSKNPANFITKGNRVEVRSDEEGYVNAWFRATILELPRSRNKKVLVKYEDLLEDDGGKLLNEDVCPTYIRPMPPKDDNNVRPFKVFDVVDAFDSDGWWKGVVTRVREVNGENKYIVVFDTPPEQKEFRAGDLRFHRDWSDDKWGEPQKQRRMKGLEFSKCTTVEVNLLKAKPAYVWFKGVILEEVGFNSFLVKFGRGNNNKSSKVAIVDSFHIRHCHPRFEVKEFEILDKVYVFLGWARKEGFITRSFTDGTYLVYLKDEKVTKQFPEAKLMLFLQFVDGKWVGRHCKDGSLRESDYLINKKEKSSNLASQLDSASGENYQVQEKSPCLNSCMKQLAFLTSSNSKFRKARRSPRKRKASNTLPCKKFKGEKSAKLSSAAECHETSTPPTPLEQSNGENFTSCVLAKCSSSPFAENHPSVESTIPMSRKEAHEEKATREGVMMTSAEAPQNSVCEGQEVLASGEKVNTKDAFSETFAPPSLIDHMEIDCFLNTHDTEIVDQPQLLCSEGGEDNENEVLGQTLVPQSSTDCMAEEVSMIDVGTNCIVKSSGTLMDDHCQFLCSEETSAPLVTIHCMEKMVTNDVAIECILEPCDTSNVDQQSQLLCLEGGKNDSKITSTDISSPLSATDCRTKEADIVDMVTGGVENSNSVHQPQFLFLEGHSPCNTQNQLNDVLDGRSVPRKKSPVTIVEVNIEPVDNVETPFIKHPCLWKSVDSLEIFKLMPQEPHFRPLMTMKEALREGFALGYMVTFANVVEKISKLLVTDSQDKFDDHLETLTLLEANGFSVKPLVDCVNRLLSKKDNKRRLEDQSKEVKVQLAERTCEQARLDARIHAINKVLSELGKDRGLCVLLKKNNSGNITNLQLESSAIDEGISAVIRSFESLVAAPWSITTDI